MKQEYVIPKLDILELNTRGGICDISNPGGTGDNPGQGGMDAPIFDELFPELF